MPLGSDRLEDQAQFHHRLAVGHWPSHIFTLIGPKVGTFTVLGTYELFRNVATIIISRVNPLLPVKLETVRFSSHPATHISEFGAPPAGHS